MGLPLGYGHGWGTGGGWTSPPRSEWYASPKWHAPPKIMCPCPHKPMPEWHGGWPNHYDGARGGNGGGMNMRPYNAELGGLSGGGHQESMLPSLSANGKEISSSADGGGDNEQGELVPMNGGWYPAGWGSGWGGSSWGGAQKRSETSSRDWNPSWNPSWGGDDYWSSSKSRKGPSTTGNWDQDWSNSGWGWSGASSSTPPMCECETPHPTKSPTHHPTDNQSGHL